MPTWTVKATWIEDEALVSEQWNIASDTVADAVRDVTSRLRFRPHHVEARLLSESEEGSTLGIPQRIPANGA
jgi:hypothetical protein